MTQPVFVRYLQPPPSTIEMTDAELPQPSPLPIILVQKDEAVESLDAIVYRELPPPQERGKIINVRQARKQPRPIIIEKTGPVQPKPAPILIERWLPRGPPKIKHIKIDRPQEPLKRKVIVVERKRPNVRVVKEFINLGTKKVSEEEYLRALNQSARRAQMEGKSVYIEARVDKETFDRHIRDRDRSGVFENIDFGRPVTMVSPSEARI
ncbi:hypothetical protein ACOME3_003274 [Neoechinorhynchus agilis]